MKYESLNLGSKLPYFGICALKFEKETMSHLK